MPSSHLEPARLLGSPIGLAAMEPVYNLTRQIADDATPTQFSRIFGGKSLFCRRHSTPRQAGQRTLNMTPKVVFSRNVLESPTSCGNPVRVFETLVRIG
jgi:hypothetical protein